MKKDIVIIGGGPAGLSFARSLVDTDLQIVIIEKQPKESLANPADDGREIALTHFSKAILQKLGAWQHIPEESRPLIKEAKVLDGDSSYALHFDYREMCKDALGYLVSNHAIRKALYEEVKTQDNVELIDDTAVRSVQTGTTQASVTLEGGQNINTSLIVAADSRFSTSRRQMSISASMQDFGKTAIVCKMQH